MERVGSPGERKGRVMAGPCLFCFLGLNSNVIVQRFKGLGFKVGDRGLVQTWTVDAFALKGESMKMEGFEDIETS